MKQIPFGLLDQLCIMFLLKIACLLSELPHVLMKNKCMRCKISHFVKNFIFFVESKMLKKTSSTCRLFSNEGHVIIKGSLSKNVFERRTSTRSESFSFLICLIANKFVLLSFFSLIRRFTREFEPNHYPMMQKVHFRLTSLAQKRFSLSSLF